MSKERPDIITDSKFRFDAFANGETLHRKKKGVLPPMGWNSWNAFGSGNTEELTKAMADCMVDLGLNQLGYEYIVLDDGCYKQERVNGLLSNEEEKFPSGFRSLADSIHAKGLKFGMYNDIGTNLCAGAAVGTCGHETEDAASYVEWGVDFLKIDNCYYLWDNATFSNAENARYVFAPNIRAIRMVKKTDAKKTFLLSAVHDGKLTGTRAEQKEDYVTGIGTFDGTGPVASPVGDRSSELHFSVSVEEADCYELSVEYATSKEEGIGSWLQLAVEEEIFYDDFLKETENSEHFVWSEPITVTLHKGTNLIRFMNHRRQENTLCSYAALLEGLNKADPNHSILLSLCEWGKTQPQNWGYKVGDCWRILNDITFQVGADQNPGIGHWKDDYTTGITTQYNKAVIMDSFSGLEKGWNDPDMMVIGMDGLTETMYRTHMVMWCMMNAPLMLGLDLRRVQKGDNLYRIIANKNWISLNQDALGIQAKRICVYDYCETANKSSGSGFERRVEDADTAYLRDINRVDILVKPLEDGSIAMAFINVSEEKKTGSFEVTLEEIAQKMKVSEELLKADEFRIMDLWDNREWSAFKKQGKAEFKVEELEACDSVTWRIWPMKK